MCGELGVFENRTGNSGRRIHLRIAKLPARDTLVRNAPIFVLVGGPGQSAVDNAASYARLLAPLHTEHDLVFVDQRGTGGSNPLPCDLYSKQPSGPLGDFLPLEAIMACRIRLEERADLRFYTSPLAADDLDDVRTALGYAQINLEAASYGTRVALLYLRQYSVHVRSAVLRSVSPPWVRQPLHFAEDAQAALDSLVRDCQAAPVCRAAFPRFREEFGAVLAHLDTFAVPVEVEGPDTAKHMVHLTRGPFTEKIRLMLYAPEVSSFLPLLIHQAAAGNYAPFTSLAYEMGEQIAQLASNGMYLSVTCPEDVAQITPTEAANEWPGTFLGDYRVQQQRAACAAWPSGLVPPNFSAPIRSSVPVLVVSSAIDPITPPRWGEEVAHSLSNARHIVVPRGGHSPTTSCVMGIVQQFFASASHARLDVQCLNQSHRPPFALELP